MPASCPRARVALGRIGRPTFLADTALSVLFGAAGGLLVTAVVVLAGFPEWGETLLGILVVFAAFFLIGLGIRGGLHLVFVDINHGLDPSGDRPRAEYLSYSRGWMRFGAGSAGAAAVLSLAFLLRTGDAFPG